MTIAETNLHTSDKNFVFVSTSLTSDKNHNKKEMLKGYFRKIKCGPGDQVPRCQGNVQSSTMFLLLIIKNDVLLNLLPSTVFISSKKEKNKLSKY